MLWKLFGTHLQGELFELSLSPGLYSLPIYSQELCTVASHSVIFHTDVSSGRASAVSLVAAKTLRAQLHPIVSHSWNDRGKGILDDSGWVGTVTFIPGPLFRLEREYKLIGLMQIIKIVAWVVHLSSESCLYVANSKLGIFKCQWFMDFENKTTPNGIHS